MSVRTPLLALTIALSLTSCASAPTPAPDEAQTTPATEAPMSNTPYDATSPAGAQLSWVLSQLNAGQPIAEETLRERFAPMFLAQVPPDALAKVFSDLHTQIAPLTPTRVAGETPHALSVLTKGAEDKAWAVSIAVNAKAPHQIEGLLFQPAPRAATELPQRWETIEEELKALAPVHELYVARIDAKGACAPLHQVAPSSTPAIGSTFKVYILAALADAVASGKMSWDDKLAIDDTRKSLPSGKLQDEAAGTELSLGEMADLMISISDNTATDHLLHHVGREAVEAQVAASGHHEPALMRPMLSTQELFKLKLTLDKTAREAYLKGDEAARRASLNQEVSQARLPAVDAPWPRPIAVDTLEWFANGQDLCGLFGSLVAKHEAPSHARALKAMSINDAGLKPDPKQWKYVGYKGGSEPGVVSMAWLLQGQDDQWYTIALALNNGEGAVDVSAMLDLGRASLYALERELTAPAATAP